MLALVLGIAWAGLVACLLCRAVRQFRAFRDATLRASADIFGLPAVSIIVPVRNEIANLSPCLAGLTAQTCLSGKSSIIFVDDDSQDGTLPVLQHQAALDPRIRLITLGRLAEDWVGKPRACWRGALAAETDWLCFIDADVRAAPRLVASALAFAVAEGADMLSLHPLQELGSFWERLIVPAGLLMLACAKPFRTRAEDVANGQFLLIRREPYFRVGGHSVVRGDICEDKALASRFKEAGLSFRVLAAERLARTRMYRDLGSLWEGFSKNATEMLGSCSATLIAAAAGFLCGWATLLLPTALIAAALDDDSPATAAGAALALLASAAVIAIQLGTVRHFRIPLAFAFLSPLGNTAAACLACHSVLARWRGRVRWKGRTYQLSRPAPERT
jgi:chlorobactene glucosyltransferase